jgi:hypothetical protein
MHAQNFCLVILIMQFILKPNFAILKPLLNVISPLVLSSFKDLFFSILPDQGF